MRKTMTTGHDRTTHERLRMDRRRQRMAKRRWRMGETVKILPLQLVAGFSWIDLKMHRTRGNRAPGRIKMPMLMPHFFVVPAS